MRWWNEQKRRQHTAMAVALCLTLPLAVVPTAASAQVFGNRRQTPVRQGMSTKKKLVLLAGAALAYYLYKKHQTKRQQAERQASLNRTNQTASGMTTARRMPQLYRSRNGGIYYRDPNGRPVWLTAPTRGIQVPAEEVRRYAPDYNRYRGPAPSVPRGARTESFEQFDESLLENSYSTSGGGRMGAGGNLPPGPRRY